MGAVWFGFGAGGGLTCLFAFCFLCLFLRQCNFRLLVIGLCCPVGNRKKKSLGIRNRGFNVTL